MLCQCCCFLRGCIMLILWALYLLLPKTNSQVISVTESLEDIPENITTLHPVIFKANITEHFDVRPLDSDDNASKNKPTNIKSEATVWKIETAFAESKLPEKEEQKEELEWKEDSKGKDSKEEVVLEKPDNKSNEFKPSVHFEDFFDLDDDPPEKEVSNNDAPYYKKPFSGFQGYPKEPKKPTFSKFKSFPYKFESPSNNILKNNDDWKPKNLNGKLPADGVYTNQDPFEDKPNSDNDDFGLGFHDAKEKYRNVKKRPHSWHHLLHTLTSIIPVGLIIAALTPNIITIQDTGPTSYYSNRYARSVANTPYPRPFAPISERCRRRLLCELYTDKHYDQLPRQQSDLNSSCNQYRCYDTRTLTKLLAWIFQPKSKSKGNAVT